MNPHRHAIEKLYAHLHSSEQGLTQAGVVQRLVKHGANRIEEVAAQSFVGKLLKEFTHFFALILWLAAGLAFIAEWKDPGQGMAMLGYGIGFEFLLLVLIDYTPWGNALFGTAPLGAEVWLFIIPFGVGMLLLEELRKAVVRRNQNIQISK